MRYNFILRYEDNYPVEKMCKFMTVSKSAYYHWNNTELLVQKKTPKMYLKERIKIVFEESRQIYGSCRIQKMLAREGLNYSRSYIGLLMKEMCYERNM